MIPMPRTTIGKRPPKTIEATHPHETPFWPLTLILNPHLNHHPKLKLKLISPLIPIP